MGRLLTVEEIDSDLHQYTPGGRPVPSVTDVLKATGFIRQRSGQSDMLDYYRDRGKWAHRAIVLLERNQLVRSDMDSRLEPYLQAWQLFKKDSGLEINDPVQDMEQARYCSNFGIAGTLDFIGTIPHMGLILGDNKTGPAPTWTRLQLALYDLMDTTPFKVIRLGLELRADGKYQPHWYRDYADYEMARQLVRCYWWQVENGLRAIGD